MQKQIRLILVDDHQAIRDSWQFLFNNDNRFTIIGQCRNGAEAIEEASRLLPDVVLMDINMSPVNGFEATQQIASSAPSVRVIGVSANNHPSYAYKILQLGGKGFVTKSSPFDELTRAIIAVHNGDQYICTEVMNDSSYQHKGE